MNQIITFRIEGSYSPADMPLERLGEYLIALGELFGDQANVHFKDITAGSTIVRAEADHVVARKVIGRVNAVAAGDGSEALRKSYRKIDDMLHADNATGRIEVDGANVIFVDFAGRDRLEPLVYGPIRQPGVIDGEIVRIEGSDATVHVGVVDGARRYSLTAPAAMGRTLASHFRAGPIRFVGEGSWIRSDATGWELKRFMIDRVETLDSKPLSAIVDELRAIGSGDWAEHPSELADLRGGDKRAAH